MGEAGVSFQCCSEIEVMLSAGGLTASSIRCTAMRIESSLRCCAVMVLWSGQALVWWVPSKLVTRDPELCAQPASAESVVASWPLSTNGS